MARGRGKGISAKRQRGVARIKSGVRQTLKRGRQGPQRVPDRHQGTRSQCARTRRAIKHLGHVPRR